MKLSAKTLQILKNFSTINPSIMFNCGNELTTISPQKSVMAKAKIDETIEKDFGIYDLSRFLGVLSLFNEPEMVLSDNYVKITDGKKSVNFIYADPVTMILPPKKSINMGESFVEFDLPSDIFQSVMKGAGVLGLPEIAVEAADGNLMLRAIDVKNPSNNTFDHTIKDDDRSYRIVFNSHNLKIMTGDYRVCIAKGISHFSNDGVEYWIATETSSTYGE